MRGYFLQKPRLTGRISRGSTLRTNERTIRGAKKALPRADTQRRRPRRLRELAPRVLRAAPAPATAAVVAVAAVAVAAVVVVVVVAVDQMFVAFFVAPDGAPSPRLCP